MPPLGGSTTGREYWRSLDELADTPQFRAFVESEFPSLAPEMLSSTTRRQFLKLMGASAALAGLTGCRWPEEKITPYAHRPEDRTPGVPAHYATALERNGVATGLLVASYDGRPVKIEGNPSHPLSRGASDVFMQASVLELYDPDRSRYLVERDKGQSSARAWDRFASFARSHFGSLRDNGGRGFAILSEATASPSVADLRARIHKAFPQAEWYEYEPISRDQERSGAALAWGQPYRTHYALDQASVVVCLDANLLMTHPAALRHARDFVAGREIDRTGRRRDGGGAMNRLYAIESTFSITGAMADHRWAVPSHLIPAVACRLATELVGRGLSVPVLAPLVSALEPTGSYGVLGAEIAAAVAADLLANPGRSVIAAGAQQPPEVHALVHTLNAALGNVGRTVTYTAEIDPNRPSHVEAVATLADRMNRGEVATLLILGGNPVYDAPTDLDFAHHLESVDTTIHLSLYRNETSKACRWQVPRAHPLESWGDARSYDGTLSIIQPLIAPLYGGKTIIEVLAAVLNEEPTKGYDIVRRTLRGLCDPGPQFEAFWRTALHDGVVAESAWPVEQPALHGGDWIEKLSERARETAAVEDRVEIVFRPDASVYDGRFTNNGWLQELPDPMTKLTWDNAAIISPSMAQKLGVERGDVLSIQHDGRTLEIAAYVLPGQAAGSVTLPLGYGRTAAGRVGDGTGFDTYRLRTSTAMHVALGATITRTGRAYKLATTQDHHAMDSEVGRREESRRLGALIREATVKEYRRSPAFAKHVVHHPPLQSLWEPITFPGKPRWAMGIDLNRCTGCSACVMACQAENNVPVVGKDEVDRGREMQWIRVDRYFRGDPQQPEVAVQPVTCHHCENAPCEQVCPVGATVHSQEGLNDMVYNRCIGTRYCSNNCPYKVRRFNWFNNHKDLSDVERMVFNPDVTVRSRGVMEKCTYCVQRINAVKIAAKNEGRPIADGEIRTACQQACPTQAIVFGDLNDPHSAVSKAHADDRAYAMLAELNVKPRTQYLAKLRNPAPDRNAATEEPTPKHG